MKKIFYGLVFCFALTLSMGLVACAQPEPLPTPNNLQIEGRTLTWDAVEGAEGYYIYMESLGEFETTECSFEFYEICTAGSYLIEVQALGDGKTASNSSVAQITFELGEPEMIGTIDGFPYLWDESLQGYMIGGSSSSNITGDIVLPDLIHNYPVKRIFPYGFTPYVSILERNPLTGENCNVWTTSVVLPSHLELIDEAAFAYCLKLEEIVIPDTVRVIGPAAFLNDINLRHVTLPQGLKEIEFMAFEDCSLEELILPEGLEVIGSSAFQSGTVVGDLEEWKSHYHGDMSFTELIIPDSVKEIDYSAFSGCVNLKDIKMSKNLELLSNSVFDFTAWYEAQSGEYIMLDDILYEYRGEIPENGVYEVPSFVKRIGSSVFQLQSNLTDVIIPDGVKLIGKAIFGNCLSLSKVWLPGDLEVIPESTFSGCESLIYIDIPPTVKEIGQFAFFASGIEKINLSEGLETIGMFAFRLCNSLKESTLPASLKTLGYAPFYKCDNLKSIYFKGGRGPWSVLEVQARTHVDEVVYSFSTAFSNATVYCYSENAPTSSGNYWHYDSAGRIKIW